MKRLLGSLTIITFVLVIGALLVVYAKGNRLNKNGQLTGSGILQIDTTPNSADIYVNGSKKGLSDFNVENLLPGTYAVKIVKEHYQTWEKSVLIKKGLVTPLKINLFPSNPSLTALTFDGVSSPILSPDKKKVVFGVQAEDKKGVWVISLTDKQLFFGNTAAKEIAADTNLDIYSNATYAWSPDSNAVLVTTLATAELPVKTFLLQADTLNKAPTDITSSSDELKATWAKQVASSQEAGLKKLGNEAMMLAVDAKSVTFSKDQTAVLIIKADGTAVVYDTKPSPVPDTPAATYLLPAADKYVWFDGNNKNLIAVKQNALSVMDEDGSNSASLFTGNFDQNVVYSWPDGSKLVITINLNSLANPLPNLYTIDLN